MLCERSSESSTERRARSRSPGSLGSRRRETAGLARCMELWGPPPVGSTQCRRAKVLRHRVHEHDVGGLPAAHSRAAPHADAAEASALVGLQPGAVPHQRLKHHVAQLQDVECVVEHEPCGLSPETLAAALADEDPEPGGPVGVRDLKQPGGADRGGVAAVVNRELDYLRLILSAALDVVLDPSLLALRGGDAAVVEPAPDLELVHPPRISGGEVVTERSERDLLADNDELRLVAAHPGIVAQTAVRSGLATGGGRPQQMLVPYKQSESFRVAIACIPLRPVPEATRSVSGRLDPRNHLAPHQLDLPSLVAQRPKVDALASRRGVVGEKSRAVLGGPDAKLASKLVGISVQERR